MILEDCIKLRNDEDKKSFLDLLKTFAKKSDIYEHYNVSRSSRNTEYARNLFSELGLDYETFFKKKKYCLNCGKELKYGQYKFCSNSCSATFNNKLRKKKEPKYCINCGKEISNHGNKYCSMNCQIDYIYKGYIERWKKGEENGIKGVDDISGFVRRYMFQKYNNKCQKCGWCEVNEYTNKIPLQIHHIDGDCLNNTEDNLQLLCPNCHSLTDNFGIRNKNATRKDKRKR